MHGQFYSHPHFLQRTAVSQNTASTTGGVPATPGLSQQGALRFSSQHAGLINGQAYQAQQLQQQRVPSMQHQAELTPQQYAQLFHHNQSYQQALAYNQAIQQQSQANRQQHEQQRLLQQQAQNGQSLRALLSSQYQELSRLQQQMISFDQIGLCQPSVSPRHLTATNIHQHAEHLQQQVPKKVSNLAHFQDEHRSRLTSEQRIHQVDKPIISRVHPHSVATTGVRNVLLQNPAPQGLSHEMLHQRMPSTAHRPSPPVYSHNPNLAQNMLISPQPNTGLISPHSNVFSALGQLTDVNGNRLQQTSAQVARGEISLAADHNALALQQKGNFGNDMRSRSISQDLQSPRQTTPTGIGVTKTNIQVKRQTPSVNSCSAPIIVVDSDSDVDEQAMKSMTTKEAEESQSDFARVVIDDDVEITGVKEAEIMSHMRPDCPIHAFERFDTIALGPQGQNLMKCSKCYCYVCDKLANECTLWSSPTQPHCNAHAKASCWKARRNTKKSPLMMKLSYEEITPEIAEAGELAMQYMIQIREVYITYRNGIPCEYHEVPCNCVCHRQHSGHEPCVSCKVIHDSKKKFNYEPVRDVALRIIRKIESEQSRNHPTVALIMFEAVLAELCSQRPPDFNHSTRMPSNPDVRCQCNFPSIIEEYIEKYLIEILTLHEMSVGFLRNLQTCVEEAIKPLQLKDTMKRFQNMRHWDNLLLRAVLSGSNTVGTKGREVLRETADVIKMRVEKLERDKRYQSIIRYLKIVKLQQSPKVVISQKEITALMKQWHLLYSAKLGQFKDVILRLLEPVQSEHSMSAFAMITTLDLDFVMQLLDALAGKYATQNTRLESFGLNSSQSHVITGKDADVLLLVFQYILLQNQRATSHVPFYLWLARWVNRTALPPCLDPIQIKPWITQSAKIIEISSHILYMGPPQFRAFLLQCGVHDPHVHIFVASMNIINAVGKFTDFFQTEDLQAIMEAYKNNEWALFLLMTQSPMMSFGDLNVFRWITKFCSDNNSPLAQIKDRVIIESIQPYPLADVSEFLKALIKPGWTNSPESIQQTVLAAASEYALRLLNETTQCDHNVLLLKGKWLEEVILKNLEERRISPSLLREEPIVMNYLKNVAKTCSYLCPVKRNILMYRKISSPVEWPRRCNGLILFLLEKLERDRSSVTIEEFSTLLWLLWVIGDLERMGSCITSFIDRHSCVGDGSKVSSAKVVEEVATLLDSVTNPEAADCKHRLIMNCKKLFVLETLSWMTCTDCSTKMSTGWTKIWIAISTSKLEECSHQLNGATLEQFKVWLNKISLDNEDNYKRLMSCLHSFLHTLIVTWNRCSFSFDEMRRFLDGVIRSVTDQRFKRDLESMSKVLIHAELEKIKPKKVEEASPTTPGNTSVLQSSNVIGHHQSGPSGNEQAKTPNHQHLPPVTSQATASALTNPVDQKGPLHGSRELEKGQVMMEHLSSTDAAPATHPQHKQAAKTERHAVMSPDALFNRKAQEKSIPPQKFAVEKGLNLPMAQSKDVGAPFSSGSLTRTKICENCGETISCASFKCPNCNRSSRQLRTVTCPGCGQENRELTSYSCRYCYGSLIDVLFSGVERPRVSEESRDAETMPAIATAQRKKKKNLEKRKRKTKPEDKVTMSTTTITTVPVSLEDELIELPSKVATPPSHSSKVSPLTLNLTNKQHDSTLEISSDSSSDDFVARKPVKKRKANASNSKVPPIKLKRRPSFSPPAPKPLPGASLTDSDSDSDADDEKTALIIPLEEEVSYTSNNASQILLKSPPRSNIEHIVSKLGSFSPQKVTQEKSGITRPQISLPRPQISSNPTSKSSDNVILSVKPMNNNHIATVSTHNAPPIKRGVGHSSMMSKKQKNILSRLKRPGKGVQKFTPPTKAATPRPPNKELSYSPAGKRNSLDNGNLSSQANPQNRDRQRHDSSCSNSSVGSGSGLSFGLAKVKPRNVGHRTGGAPGRTLQLNRLLSHESGFPAGENSKSTLLPQALNYKGSKHRTNKTIKKKKKELLVKMPPLTTKQTLEKKLNILLRRRKPGPANRSNYRKILRIEHKLRKLQRPNQAWRLPPSVKIPNGADLSLFMKVSLSPFPRDKLQRIQSLIPFCRIHSLYA